MNELVNLLNNAKMVEAALDDGAIIRDVLKPLDEEMLELQRIQLLEGKASSGEDLRPYYSEDLQPSGYFKTIADAKRYADWKQTISYPVRTNRNPDAPNLYINGKFHNEITVYLWDDVIEFAGATLSAQIIIDKYGSENFGLTNEHWSDLFINFEVVNQLRDIIWRML